MWIRLGDGASDDDESVLRSLLQSRTAAGVSVTVAELEELAARQAEHRRQSVRLLVERANRRAREPWDVRLQRELRALEDVARR